MKEQEKICRLCLKNCGNNFEVIETSATKILVYLLKSNLFINEAAVMCANCAEIMKDCYHFKRICLDAEDSVVVNPNDNDAKLTGANEDGYEKCRSCRGSLKNVSFVSLESKLKDVTLDQIMLNKCLPELDLCANEKPIICVSCRVSLQRYFGLITNFSIVEERIKKYCEVAGVNATGLIILKDVLEFTTNNTLGKADNIKMEDKFCGDGYVDTQKYTDEQYPLENKSANRDGEEVGGIKSEETFLEELDCKIELKPADLMKVDDLEPNDMLKFTIKCEEDDGQNDVIGMKQSYSPELVHELELKRENLSSLQDDDISPQVVTNISFPKMEEYPLAQTHRSLSQVLFVKSDKKVKVRQCKHCSFQAKDKSSLHRHQLMHKNSPKIYQCKHCLYESKYKQNLKCHLLTHENPSETTMYQCEHCSYQTKLKGNLKNHLLNRHSPSEVTTYQCGCCSYQTKYKGNLQYHSLSHKDPSEVTTYQCEHCPFQTKYKGSLKHHLLSHKTHSEIPMYQCKRCSFQTKHRHSLKGHLLSHENSSEITTYQCEHCPFQTKHKHGIKNHLLSHTRPAKITMYRCRHCSFETKVKGRLKCHLRNHKNLTEVTTYQCEHCPFQTKSKHGIKKHLLTHTRPKITMYQCEHCSFETKLKGRFKDHLLCHKNLSEVTAYQCAHCCFQTKYRRSIQNHLSSQACEQYVNFLRP